MAVKLKLLDKIQQACVSIEKNNCYDNNINFKWGMITHERYVCNECFENNKDKIK